MRVQLLQLCNHPPFSFSSLFAHSFLNFRMVTCNNRDIEANDKFIVIASDGVFEFLTNQMVADECARHNDPLVACQNVVSQAYHLWLQYEVRTDDISMIAIYIDQFSTPASTADSLLNVTAATDTASGMSGKGMEIKRQMSLELSEQRPVRRVMSREKRKNMIEVHETALDQEIAEERSVAELQAHTVPKSGEDIATISAAINSNFLFQHLDAEQRASLINVMQEVSVQAGQRVIRQGDRGDLFYVVDHGRFEVRVRANQEAVQAPTLRDKMLSIISIDRAPTASKIVFEPNFEQLGNVVHVYEGGPNSHPGFGELSLM